jgi:RAD50-interacting protein 1
LNFDAAIVEEGFQLLGTSAAQGDHEGKWKGVSEVILGNIEWFESWLEGERKCKSTGWLFTPSYSNKPDKL